MSHRLQDGNEDRQRFTRREQLEKGADGGHLLCAMDIAWVGMGWFFSIRGVFALAGCILMIYICTEDLIYGMRHGEPTQIANPEEVFDIDANDFIATNLPLDYDQGIELKPWRPVTLTPVADTSNRLIIVEKGLYTQQERGRTRAFRGRAVRKSWWDKWDTGASGGSIDVVRQFKRADIFVPNDAVLLIHGDEPSFRLRPVVFMLGSGLILAWALSRLATTIRYLRDRSLFIECIEST